MFLCNWYRHQQRRSAHKRLNLTPGNPGDWIQSESKELFPRVDTSCNKAPRVYEICIIPVLVVGVRCSWGNKKLLKAWKRNTTFEVTHIWLKCLWQHRNLIGLVGSDVGAGFSYFFLMGVSHRIQTWTFQSVQDCHKEKNPSRCNRTYPRL